MRATHDGTGVAVYGHFPGRAEVRSSVPVSWPEMNVHVDGVGVAGARSGQRLIEAGRNPGREAPDARWWSMLRAQSPELQEALTARDVGAVFRTLRARGWSVTAIAAATGVPENQVRNIAAGRQRVLTYDVLDRIATGLSIPRGFMGMAYDGAGDRDECGGWR